MDKFVTAYVSGFNKFANDDLSDVLLPHQQRVIDKLKKDDQKGIIAYHGLGSGKTLESIGAYKQLGLPTIAVLPSALQGNYKKELDKWIGRQPKDLKIISRQQVARQESPKDIAKNKFLIIDEAHAFRNTSSKAYQNLKDTDAEKRLLLTGTPIYNDPSDVANLVNLASGQDLLPENSAEFEKKFIDNKKIYPSILHRLAGVKPGVERSIKNVGILKPILNKYVDYYSGDPSQLPNVTHENIKVPMAKHQEQLYNAVMNKLPLPIRLKIKAGLPAGKSELEKMIHFLSGARIVSNSTAGFEKDDSKIESPKIDAASAFLKEKLDQD